MTDFFLGVAIDATADTEANDILDDQIRAARRLDGAGIDFLTLDDSLGPASGDTEFEAVSTLAFISAQTRQIGLVPTISTTHTEPFHIAAGTATLDYTGRARAGWRAIPSLTEADARATGRRGAAEPRAAWEETGQIIDIVRALWDSWEDGAIIRDARTNRFLDLDRIHYVDAVGTDSVGRQFTVKGPSIVPHPPQGNPPVFVTAEDEQSLSVAAAFADTIILPLDSPAQFAEVRKRAEDAISASGRSPADVTLAPSISVPDHAEHYWLNALRDELTASGARGVHLRPRSLRVDTDAISKLVFGSSGRLGRQQSESSLRSRLGLGTAVNRYAR